eukprot:GEMP01006114.1.p1 GENE.GEMP01006114.1~~GEMP01006114.1.p1  ORF type:complete len:1096 (+),score=271.58 GEMP01006114.1:59-3346(+)
MGWFGKSDKEPKRGDARRTPAATELFVSLKDVPTSVVAVLGERGSGKSLLCNLICREPMFPLEARTYGLCFASTPVAWTEISEMYGLKKQREINSVVLFAEFGSDRPPEVEQLIPVLRVSTCVVLNVFLDSDPLSFLQTWFPWVPVLSALIEDRGYRQMGDLMVVVRDWDDHTSSTDFTSTIWNYEQMPNIADSDEERRNTIRFHVQKVFKAINMYFFPFPVKQQSHLRSRVFQTKQLVPEFTQKFSDFTYDLLERVRHPKCADNGDVFTGRQVGHIANTPSVHDEEKEYSNEKLCDLYQKAVQELHEEHAVINYRRHLQHFKDLVEYHLSPPVDPNLLDGEFEKQVNNVVNLLKTVFHVATPIAVQDRLLSDLHGAAAPMLDELREENRMILKELQAEVVNSTRLDVEAEWQSLAEEPKQKAQLKVALDSKVSKCLDRQIERSKLSKIVSKELRQDLVDEVNARLTQPYQEMLETNEEHCEQLLQRESETVAHQAQVRFKEFQWQSRDHPFTNKELIHIISKWIDETVAGSKKRLDKQLEASRLESFSKQLEYDLRQMSGQCVLSNLENANAKINQEVDECLDYYRNQVLGQQIQACVINVASQTRELAELYAMFVQNPNHVPQFKNLKLPQDFLAPFKSLQFLERTFVQVLLERAEFLCCVCEFQNVHKRMKMMHEKPEDQLNEELNGQKRAKGTRDNSPAKPEAEPKVGNGSPVGRYKSEWSRIPSGVPYLEIATTSPSQAVMDSLMPRIEGAQPNALAVKNIIEALSNFKVLSVDIIDRIWASLKHMVEEDTSDLVRRQRQRDERRRQLMKLRPDPAHQAKAFQQQFQDEMDWAHEDEESELNLKRSVEDIRKEHQESVDAEVKLKDLERDKAKQFEDKKSEQFRTHLESEVLKLRDLITQQQSTLLSQQQALAQATRALEEVRREKDEVINRAQSGALPGPDEGAFASEFQPHGEPNLAMLMDNEALRRQLLKKLSEAASDDQDRKKPKKASKHNRVTSRVCSRCQKTFMVSDNNPRACRYHKGRWVTASNRGKAGVLANAAAQLMMGPSDRYRKDEGGAPGRWSCCNSNDPDDPGCIADMHAASDRMRA